LNYQRVSVEYVGDSSVNQEKNLLPESVGSCEMSLISNADKTVFAKIKLDSANKAK
jgi:hypothetical protein